MFGVIGAQRSPASIVAPHQKMGWKLISSKSVEYWSFPLLQKVSCNTFTQIGSVPPSLTPHRPGCATTRSGRTEEAGAVMPESCPRR